MKTKVEWYGMEFFICYHQMFSTLNMKWMSNAHGLQKEKPQKLFTTSLSLIHSLFLALSLSFTCLNILHTKRPHANKTQSAHENFSKGTQQHYTVNRIFIAIYAHSSGWTHGMRGFAVKASRNGLTHKNAFCRIHTINIKYHRIP